jgi:acetyl esterase/lipase
MADRRRTRSLAAFVLISSLLGGCAQAPQTAESTTGRAADGSTGSTSQTETVQTDTESEETDMTEESAAAAGPYTEDTPIDEVRNDPVFEDYGRLLFPVDEGYMSGDTLGTLQLAWYTDIQPAKTVEIVNSLYERAASGEQIFFDIYTDEEKSEDPEKINTGLFFFRGDSGAETAIVNAGGGFAYVGAMQDSFPVALELSKMGYNAFALIYRPGAGTACEDLSRAIAWLSDHAEELGIDMDGYSLWGGSAGARMADWVGTEGTEAFGEEAYPKPAAIVMQYTGLSEVTGDEPPTYANVGTADGIANYQTMQRRIEELQSLGIDAEIEVFEGLGHGFGLGTGTAAEGWVDHAAAFWEEHLPSSDNVNASIRIPDSIEEIPDEYFEPAEEGGTLEDLYYQTWESFSYY